MAPSLPLQASYRQLTATAGFAAFLVAFAPGCARAQQNHPLPENRMQAGSTISAGSASAPFLLRDGDVWVQVGDSITWQKLYTTYLEAFIRARYPSLKIATVNSGRSGEVSIQGIIRFRDTVAAYKPTLVTSAYGMNDHTKTFPSEQKFEADPASAPARFGKLVAGCGARWMVFTASPLLAPPDYATDGGAYQLATLPASPPPGWRSNPVNKLFAQKMKVVAEQSGAGYLDQMTPLQVIWGANYARDRVAALRHALLPFEQETLDAVQTSAFLAAMRHFTKELQVLENGPAPDNAQLVKFLAALKAGKDIPAAHAFLRNWAKKVDSAQPPFVQLSGYTGSQRPEDLVHPNEAGHLHMAAVLFKLMGAEGLVSEVELDGAGASLVSARKARVTGLQLQNGALSFRRLDESLPLPIAPEARTALNVDVPTSVGSPRDLFGMSRYVLQVRNLRAGQYRIAVDGEAVATASAAELAAGLDLGLAAEGPIARQCAQLLEAVRAGVVAAPVDKLTPAPPAAPQAPRTLPQAQPVERLWSITPVS